MQLTDDELSDEYKKGMEHLTQFLEKREEYRATIKAAQLRGKYIPPEVHSDTLLQLAQFDKTIDRLEAGLAKEYDRLLAEKKRNAEMEKLVDKAWESSKRLYIIIKHQKPELFDEFHAISTQDLSPDQRQQFLDEVATLESTNLQAILNGTA